MNSPTLMLPSQDVAVQPAGAGCPHLARLSQAAAQPSRPEPTPARRPVAVSTPALASGWWAFRSQANAVGARG